MHIQKLRVISVLTILALASFITACGGGTTDDAASDASAGATGGESVSWDYVLFVGLEHHYGELALAFADDVRERTDGRLDITIRPAGELPYTADEYLRRAGDGSVEIADALATFMAGDCRVGAMPSLPMLVPDFDSFDAVWELLEPEVRKCTQELGADVLYTYTWPTQNIWGTGSTPSDVQDLAGRTIRQTSPEHGLMIESVGGEAVTLTTEEVPPAAQRGVVDGVLTAALNARSSKWDEFLDWGYLLDAGVIPSYVVVDEEAYGDLPDDLRDALDEASAAATTRNNDATIEAEQAARAALKESGMELVEASDADRAEVKEMMRPIWQEWAEEAQAVDLLEQVRQRLEG